MVLYILTGYRILGIVYLDQLTGVHHTPIYIITTPLQKYAILYLLSVQLLKTDVLWNLKKKSKIGNRKYEEIRFKKLATKQMLLTHFSPAPILRGGTYYGFCFKGNFYRQNKLQSCLTSLSVIKSLGKICLWENHQISCNI